LNAKQDTTPSGAIRVPFADSNECAVAKGFTETATKDLPAKAILDIRNKPVGFTVEYLPVGKKIYGYIKPKNACLEFKDPKFLVPPSLFDEVRSKGFGWKEFIIGGVITGVSVYLLTQ
jgi:hypothetical protein